MAATDGEALGEAKELRDELTSMEARLSRLRDVRNQHNDAGKRASEARNAVQKEYKRLREEIDVELSKNKEIRKIAKTHQNRRDSIQQQVRDLIEQIKGSRKDGKKSKSFVIQLSETEAKLEQLERTLETVAMKIEKENKIVKQVRELSNKKKELEPLVEEDSRIKIDLDNIEGSIQELKAQGDVEHKAMVAAHEQADKLWEEIKPMFEERDFKKSEGDRLHNEFLECREQADGVHQQIVELLNQVNEIRDKLKQERLEAKAWIDEHNEAVRKALTTPDQDENLASRMAETLIAGDSLSIGGIDSSESSEADQKPLRKSRSTKKTTMRRIGAARGGRGKRANE